MNSEELFTQQSSTTQPREKKSIWMIIKSETGNWRCFMFHCKFINLYSLKMNFNLNDFSNYKKNSTLCIFSKEFDILKEIEISSSSITTTTKLEYLTYIQSLSASCDRRWKEKILKKIEWKKTRKLNLTQNAAQWINQVSILFTYNIFFWSFN